MLVLALCWLLLCLDLEICLCSVLYMQLGLSILPLVGQHA